MNTSMYEIDWRVKKITTRNGNEKKFLASLYGYNLDVPENENKKEAETEKAKVDDNKMRDAINRAHARRLNG